MFFVHYWIGFALSGRMKGWGVLRSNNTPKHLGNHKPAFYESILTAVDRVGVDFDLLQDHRVKTFYFKLLPIPSAWLPCIFVWERWLGIKLNPTRVWKEIYGGLSSNWESELAWLITHCVVKTRAYLKLWRRLAISEFCALCGQRETISHAFCECSDVSPVWDWLTVLIEKLHPSPILLNPHIILLRDGLPGGRQTLSNLITSFLSKLALNELWAARNLFTL